MSFIILQNHIIQSYYQASFLVLNTFCYYFDLKYTMKLICLIMSEN